MNTLRNTLKAMSPAPTPTVATEPKGTFTNACTLLARINLPELLSAGKSLGRQYFSRVSPHSAICLLHLSPRPVVDSGLDTRCLTIATSSIGHWGYKEDTVSDVVDSVMRLHRRHTQGNVDVSSTSLLQSRQIISKHCGVSVLFLYKRKRTAGYNEKLIVGYHGGNDVLDQAICASVGHLLGYEVPEECLAEKECVDKMTISTIRELANRQVVTPEPDEESELDD